VLQHYKATEQNWQSVPQLKGTHSPEYVGRAVVRLAADRQVMRKSGQAFRVGDLARFYRFTDVDGRRVPPFKVIPFEKVMKMFKVKP